MGATNKTLIRIDVVLRLWLNAVMKNLAALIIIIMVFVAPFTSPASSAVAVGRRSDGKMVYGCAVSYKFSESEAKSRAIGYCLALGGHNPHIIASTTRPGYGAIFSYSAPGHAENFVAVVGMAGEQQALNSAAQKAKSAGGQHGKLVRAWHDVTTQNYNF